MPLNLTPEQLKRLQRNMGRSEPEQPQEATPAPKKRRTRAASVPRPVESVGLAPGVLNGTMHLFARPREYNDGHSWQSKCGRRTSAIVDFEAEGARECPRCYKAEEVEGGKTIEP